MPLIRDFHQSDTTQVNAQALRAFEQFQYAYHDWPAVQVKIANMSSLADLRMLVVSPGSRGHGIGRTLAEECLCRAKRDGASVFALHTSKLMQVALPAGAEIGIVRRKHRETPLGFAL